MLDIIFNNPIKLWIACGLLALYFAIQSERQDGNLPEQWDTSDIRFSMGIVLAGCISLLIVGASTLIEDVFPALVKERGNKEGV